jgi:hypothetical protein
MRSHEAEQVIGLLLLIYLMLCNIEDQIVLKNRTLGEILNVANVVLSRGEGISMHQTLNCLEYKKIRSTISNFFVIYSKQ